MEKKLEFTKFGTLIFFWALVLQAAHLVEHAAQVYEHAVLRLPVKESHGIIFFFDLEWNHFDFNLAYFLLLSVVFVKHFYFDGSRFSGFKENAARFSFLGGFAVQGYHVLEHTARIGQFLDSGCTPCPGVLGWYLDGIYLHFVLGVVPFVLPLAAFFAFGLHRLIFKKSRAEKP